MKLFDLEHAYMWVSSSPHYENTAIVSKTTGKVWLHSEVTGDDELPEDAESNDDYLWIPHMRDLDLGSRLVFDFARLELPEEYDRIRGFFRHPGAYSRLKDFLDDLELLERWYEFEAEKTREALLSWAEDEGLPVEHEDPLS